MSHHRIKPKSANDSLRRDWRLLWPVLVILAIPLSLTALVIVKLLWTDHPQKLVAGDDLHLETDKLRPNRLHLFETEVSGHSVRFVVERTQSQSVHVAVAACRFCYHERRSNQVQDGAVICGRCRSSMDFESSEAAGHANSCKLAEIPHQQTQQTLTVMARDIAQTVTKLAQQ